MIIFSIYHQRYGVSLHSGEREFPNMFSLCKEAGSRKKKNLLIFLGPHETRGAQAMADHSFQSLYKIANIQLNFRVISFGLESYG